MTTETFKLTDNDIFSRLRGIDLQELLVQVENFYLEYRDVLNLDEDLTFGLELEYEKIPKRKTDKFLYHNYPFWDSKTDGSLDSGGEITSPILTDCNKTWKELEEICNYLKKKHADTMHSASSHMHFGTSYIDDDYNVWRTFLKLYTSFEHILFRFYYGDMVNGRRKLTKYASPAAPTLYKKLDFINELDNASYLHIIICEFDDRYYALNLKNADSFYHEKDTIEFRVPNCTVSSIILQNNVNAFGKMLMACKNSKIDEDYINYRLRREFVYFGDCNSIYNEKDLKSVLNFVDQVFDNNLDKIYFLRQYLKDFEDNFRILSPKKAKQFTR